MIEFIGGVAVGFIIVIYIGWLDTQIFPNASFYMKDPTRFKAFALATAWELLFFVGGILFARCLV
jgi:hypothetical protein